MLTFTEITSSTTVAKKLSLDQDGKLVSETTANVYSGSMRRLQMQNAQAFARLLSGLTTKQCLVYGVPPRDAKLVTERRWAEMGRPDDHLPRSTEIFTWPAGPGIMLLDYDAPKDGTSPLTKEELLAVVEKACPMIFLSDFVWWPSSSSEIYTTDGKQLRGIRGQRLYPCVQDASDILRAGNALNERMWAHGHGRYEVSKSGSLLERGVFDSTVWQTNRIDFAAGADCAEGLEQRRGAPVVHEGLLGGELDTRAAIADLTPDEVAAAQQAKERAKAGMAEAAAQAKAAWVEERVRQLKEKHPNIEAEVLRKQALRAVEGRELMGDWILHIRGDNDQILQVSVLNVLEDPATYHGMLTLDPLEPEYDGGRWVGKLYLYSARPNLYSMAHGGVKFRLFRQPLRIEYVKGRGSETTDALLAVLRRAPDVFDFGAELVVVGRGGTVDAMDEHLLRYEVGKLTQFWSRRRLRDGSLKEELLDPPPNICKSVLDLRSKTGPV
jgi:hypothetical protein